MNTNKAISLMGLSFGVPLLWLFISNTNSIQTGAAEADVRNITASLLPGLGAVFFALTEQLMPQSENWELPSIRRPSFTGPPTRLESPSPKSLLLFLLASLFGMTMDILQPLLMAVLDGWLNFTVVIPFSWDASTVATMKIVPVLR